MGSITTRDEWPPQPKKKYVPQYEKRLVLVDGKWIAVDVLREDYVSPQWPVRRTGGNKP